MRFPKSEPTARPPSLGLPGWAGSAFSFVALWLALLFPPGSPASPPFKPSRLVVHPPSVELTGADGRHALLVTAVASDGRRADVTGEVTFSSGQSNIVTVETNGLCRARGDGSAEILVTLGNRRVRVPITVTSSGSTPPPSFRQDIEPLLTRAGCNMGACHGKLAGQNGFKLSLRGYAPELDHPWLTTDLSGRRINPAFPDDSLLILKALGKVPHEGRQRFAEGSRYHQTLVDWMSARVPGPDTNEADAVRMEILPGDRTLRVGETQQLMARAFYKDGRTRDVTWLAQFFSNEETTASVTPDGLVKAMRHGETSIRVHFQGQVEVVTMTIPYENRVASREFAKVKSPLDTAVFAKLKTLNIPPSPECDDAAFLRRASLDVTGTLPGPAEVRAFLADTSKDKRSQLVERLLASPEFVDYWTLQLADLLQNRKERDHDVRGVKGVRAFHAWLRGRVARNQPWNALARDILTARGSVAEHPEIGYFIYNLGEKRHVEESETPDAVAQSFLGTRIGCARCHNHPLEKYTQDDFYHFAAFFSKVQMKRTEPDKGATILNVSTREEEEQIKRVAEAEKSLTEATNAMTKAEGPEMEKARKKMTEQMKKVDEARLQLQKVSLKMPTVTQPRTKKSMAPQPLDHQALVFEPGADPREQLAEWMTNPQNPQFSGAMVNRIWKHFLGVGLVEPVDDLRASNPPSNPELWKWLNAEFVQGGYDLKHLMRLILNSRVYQASSATRRGNETDKKFYSHYYARRLPAEVMLDAIALATGVPDEFKGYPVGTRAVQLPEPGVSSYFLSLFGRSDRVTACACERNGEVTLPQLLHLQNGDATIKKVAAGNERLKALVNGGSDDGKVIEELFLATLNRLPAATEIEAVKKALAGGDREEGLRDLFWALLNSKEFAFNH